MTKVVTLRNHFLSNLYSRSRCIYFCSKPAVIEAEAGNLGAPGAAFVLLDGGGKGAGGASSQQPGARDPWDEHDPWQSETRVPVTSGVGAASPDSAAGSALRSTTPAPGKRRAHSPVRHAMSPGGPNCWHHRGRHGLPSLLRVSETKSDGFSAETSRSRKHGQTINND